MRELIGKRCDVRYFDTHSQHPNWVDVLDVDMPMIKVRANWGGAAMWLNVAVIERIMVSQWR